MGKTSSCQQREEIGRAVNKKIDLEYGQEKKVRKNSFAQSRQKRKDIFRTGKPHKIYRCNISPMSARLIFYAANH